MSAATIVCPFCPLHCDDLPAPDLAASELADVVAASTCPIRDHGLRDLKSESQARVENRSVRLEAAEQVVKELVESNQDWKVLVGNAGLRLSRELAKIDPRKLRSELSLTQQALKAATRRCGTVTATLGDVRAHADLVVLLGDVENDVPRLREYLGWTRNDTTPEIISVAQPDAGLIADLAVAMSHRSKINESSVIGRIVRQAANSKYTSFLVASDAFDCRKAEMAAELLIKLVIGLNEADREIACRAVVLTLGLSTTFSNVHSWSSDHPLRAATPGDFERSLTLRLGNPIQGARAARVQIGGNDPGLEMAEFFLPAAFPGIHYQDMVIRGDGTVSLPLSKIAVSPLPTMDQWLGRLNLVNWE